MTFHISAKYCNTESEWVREYKCECVRKGNGGRAWPPGGYWANFGKSNDINFSGMNLTQSFLTIGLLTTRNALWGTTILVS